MSISTIYDHPKFAGKITPLAHGGEPPHDGGMDTLEPRVRALEERAATIDERTKQMALQMATKADLANLRADLVTAINAQTWKILGLLVALVGASIAIAKFVH